MPVEPHHHDRHAAGVSLVHELAQLANRHDVVVLGLARGGVAVAAPIAHALGAPLHAFVARKLGVPGIEEVAFGAIAEGHTAPALDAVHEFIGLPRSIVRSVVKCERQEITRRVQCYRDGRPLPDLAGRTVIVVDDGLASGATLRVAALALRHHRPARLIAAVPVASATGLRDAAALFDDTIALATPEPFGTVSDWYRDYDAVSDAEVRALLGLSSEHAACATASAPQHIEHEVRIPTLDAGPCTHIAADVGQGPGDAPPRGLVIFAHGGGSSRGSYRNRYLAARIRHAGWSTLRLDLLGDMERDADSTGDLRFDIDLVTRRLLAATRWCIDQSLPGSDRIVLFGASTGAAAAMGVAANPGMAIAGVVARAGRIDLAAGRLQHVHAPTLLVVGGADQATSRLNREGARQLAGAVTMRVVRGAGHEFAEPGALGAVGEHTATWLGWLHLASRLRRWRSAATAFGSRRDASQSTAS